jgi:hypothetical protein
MAIISRKNGNNILNSWGLIFISIVVAGLILTSATLADAETRKWKINNHITKMKAIPIPNSPGRAIGFFERQGEVQYEDGETATQLLRCTFDMVRGQGPYQGYAQIKFKDGSSFLVRIKGEMIMPKTGKLPISKGTGKYIAGTGRFKGIQGNLSFKAKVLKPYAGESKGDALVEATGTYTLPSK